MNEIKQIIFTYLNAPTTDYAILLNGEWGSGKTFYLKQEEYGLKSIIEKEAKKKVILVSLNGLNDIDDLNRNILFARIGNNNFFEYGYRLLKGLSELSDEFATIKILKRALTILENAFPKTKTGKLKDKENLKKILNFDNCVIVLDDFERSCIPLEEFFGYITHNFLESQKTKIILIADESKIPEKEKYDKVKEKVIGRTLPFKLDLRESYKSIIDSFKDNVIHQILTKNKEFILKLLERFQIRNIRTINFIFHNLHIVTKAIKEKEYQEKLIENIIYFITIYSHEYRKGNFNLSKTDFIEATQNLSYAEIIRIKYGKSLSSKDNLEEEIESLAEEFSDLYFNTFEEIKYLHFKSIYNLILFGNLDDELLNQEITEHFKNEQPNEIKDAIYSITSYLSLNEEELQGRVDNIILMLKEHKFLSYDVLFIFELFLEFIEKNLIRQTKEQMKEIIVDSLKYNFNKDLKVGFGFHNYSFNRSEVREMAKNYEIQIKRRRETNKERNLKSYFENIDINQTELNKFFNEEFTYLVFNKLKVDFFIDLLSKYSNRQLVIFRSFIISRYKTYSNIKDTHMSEYYNIKKLLEFVKDLSSKSTGIREINLNLLSKELEDACKILEPQKES